MQGKLCLIMHKTLKTEKLSKMILTFGPDLFTATSFSQQLILPTAEPDILKTDLVQWDWVWMEYAGPSMCSSCIQSHISEE